MHESDKKPLLVTLEYIPLISTIIILLGCMRLYAYYAVFNLSIFDYAELADFISQGIGDFFLLTSGLLFGLAFPSNFFKTPFKDERLGGTLDTHMVIKNCKKFATYIEYASAICLACVLIHLLVSYLITGVLAEPQRLKLYGNLLFAVGVYLAAQLTFAYIDFKQHKVNKVYAVFIPMLTIYCFSALYTNFSAAINVKYNNENIGNSITIENLIYTSNKDYYYIGQTKSFVFFHNAKNGANDIFQKSQISKITVKK